jgi:hypothetical protein
LDGALMNILMNSGLKKIMQNGPLKLSQNGTMKLFMGKSSQ